MKNKVQDIVHMKATHVGSGSEYTAGAKTQNVLSEIQTMQNDPLPLGSVPGISIISGSGASAPYPNGSFVHLVPVMLPDLCNIKEK